MSEPMTLLPCPFCGATDAEVYPRDRSNSAWNVCCGNPRCVTRGDNDYLTESDAIAAWNRRAHLAQPAQAVDVGARSAKDYAIEHAGYLATSVHDLLHQLGEESVAFDQHENDSTDETLEALEAAQESVSHARDTVRVCLYEFEKRRDRALASNKAVDVGTEWNKCYSAIIKALAAMVYVGAPDNWPEDAIRRDPIMAEILRIRQALDTYRELTRAISGEKAGRVDGWKLVPLELTPEMAAAASAAVWPVASVKDREKARAAALIVLKTTMDLVPGATLDSLAAGIATMFPAYRAFLAASPTPDKEGM